MFTNELHEAVHQYGWSPESVRWKNGIWQVTEGDNVYALKQTSQSREKLLLLENMLEQLREAGYPHLLPWISASTGEKVVSVRKTHWYATEWKETKGETTISPSAEEQIQSLAIFHRLAEPIANRYPVLQQHLTEDTVEKWKENREKLQAYIHRTQEEEFPSPFSQLLDRYQKGIEEKMGFAIRGIEAFLEREQGKSPRYTLCHRRIHPRNLCYDQEGWYWIDFDHAEVDSPIRDLALFLRRCHSEKDEEYLLKVYERENPLLPLEKKLLAIHLSYPERLIRLCQYYFEKPYLSEENQQVQKLEGELSRLERRSELIQKLWTKKKQGKQRKGSKTST